MYSRNSSSGASKSGAIHKILSLALPARHGHELSPVFVSFATGALSPAKARRATTAATCGPRRTPRRRAPQPQPRTPGGRSGKPRPTTALPTSLNAQTLWDRRDPNFAHLFQDYRARNVGDILTVADQPASLDIRPECEHQWYSVLECQLRDLSSLLSKKRGATNDNRVGSVSHAGGMIPMLAGRIDSFYGARPNLTEFAPEGIVRSTRNEPL